MFTVSVVCLLVVVAVAAVVLCSAHIPILRDLTGAAPLQREAPEPYPCIRNDGCRQLAGVCLHGCRDAADEHTRLSQELDTGEVAP